MNPFKFSEMNTIAHTEAIVFVCQSRLKHEKKRKVKLIDSVVFYFDCSERTRLRGLTFHRRLTSKSITSSVLFSFDVPFWDLRLQCQSKWRVLFQFIARQHFINFFFFKNVSKVFLFGNYFKCLCESINTVKKNQTFSIYVCIRNCHMCPVWFIKQMKS